VAAWRSGSVAHIAQENAYAETKTMTHTVDMVVGVAYMLTWTNHCSAGVVT